MVSIALEITRVIYSDFVLKQNSSPSIANMKINCLKYLKQQPLKLDATFLSAAITRTLGECPYLLRHLHSSLRTTMMQISLLSFIIGHCSILLQAAYECGELFIDYSFTDMQLILFASTYNNKTIP